MTIPTMADLSEADYCSIEDALLASEKGRRFLRAYLGRNRGGETIRLLRSISRLHRAAIGSPGLRAEVSRDLTAILQNISRVRASAAQCGDESRSVTVLRGGLEDTEACLLVLIESMEERAIEGARDAAPDVAPHVPETSTKLFDELSAFFTAEGR
jgi:hypothetical protein